MQALRLLHEQSGDNVSRVDIDVNATTENIIRYVEIGLPIINGSSRASLEGDLSDRSDVLDGIEKFLEDDYLEGDGSDTLDDELKEVLDDDLDNLSSSLSLDDDF